MYIKVTIINTSDIPEINIHQGYINVDTITAVRMFTIDGFHDEGHTCRTLIDCINDTTYAVHETVEDIMTAINQTSGHKNLIVE